MKELEKAVGSLIDWAEIASLSCLDADGFPVIQLIPVPRKREGIQTLWFAVPAPQAEALLENPKAAVCFSHIVGRGPIRSYTTASLSGMIEVLEDAESRERIWKLGDDPVGPDCRVLKFTPRKGWYTRNGRTTDFTLPD